MTAYYNEIDASAAAVLRELIARDVIPAGDVDARSIKEVTLDDIRGYTQCHFFAGGGLWPVAGRIAGWPDSRPWWTGSCPCQPFSAAGKGLGTDDARHLWPDFHRLISAARPPVIMGEQVAGSAGYGWFDGVRTDLARENYAARAVDIPACAVDAPHQRNRLYWLAVGNGGCEHWRSGPFNAQDGQEPANADGSDCVQSHADRGGRDGRPEVSKRHQEQRASSQRADGRLLAYADELEFQRQSSAGQQSLSQFDARSLRNGSWWADAEWIVSPLDGKARRAKPGLPFLVDGLPGRVDLWRVGGNAISPILAAEAIAAFLDAEMTERRMLMVPSQDHQADARSCTCHPDDNPPVPCPRKFALTDCRAAALPRPNGETT